MNELVSAEMPLAVPTGQWGGLELSVVIPTFKERGNIAPLLERLNVALQGIAWEAIFVDDDSPDGTAEFVKSVAAKDLRIRCLRRITRRGLAGACIEGILSSAAPYVAVMDADLQHDENLLPRMLQKLRGGDDLVVGSRYIEGKATAGFSSGRDAISRVATSLAQRLTGVTLTDPMSGFFMLRRAIFDPLAAELSPHGFKILLDIVITARGRFRLSEEPFVFAERLTGKSKLDAQVGLDFLGLLVSKVSGGAVTPRFLSFALVGALGVVVHLTVLRLCLLADMDFALAQTAGTLVSMTGNFFLNNRLTYRDRRLTGWRALRGLLEFMAFSSVGAIANVGIASWLYTFEPVWWVAGIAGAVMGAVWNYSMSNLFVWRVK